MLLENNEQPKYCSNAQAMKKRLIELPRSIAFSRFI
jgi:hypothetical protein